MSYEIKARNTGARAFVFDLMKDQKRVATYDNLEIAQSEFDKATWGRHAALAKEVADANTGLSWTSSEILCHDQEAFVKFFMLYGEACGKVGVSPTNSWVIRLDDNGTARIKFGR